MKNNIDNNKPNALPINKDIDSNEPPPFTWAKLKEFCNKLTDEQLKQTVKLIQDESSIEIQYASEIGDDQYHFYEEGYVCTKENYDEDVFDGRTFEEVLQTEEHVITSGTNVYLFDE